MIRLQIHFAVGTQYQAAFERMYDEAYLPALQRQTGFVGASLLRMYPADKLAEFDATPTPYVYELELEFDTEYNRAMWAASPDHQEPWAQATALASSVQAWGYDVRSHDTATT